MSYSYQGLHADLYDSVYASKPYADEVKTIHSIVESKLKLSSKPVSLLEVACGTGKHSQEFSRLGYQVLGFDLSPDQIAVAKKNNLANCRFDVGDMIEKNYKPEKFQVATCLFDSIGYLLSNERISKAFANIYSQLKTNGIFIWEFWNAEVMQKSFSTHRERNFSFEGKDYIRVSNTSIDQDLRIATVEFSFFTAQMPDICILKETQKNRFFYLEEMKDFAQKAGFKNVEFLHAYDLSRPIDSQSWHILGVGLNTLD